MRVRETLWLVVLVLLFAGCGNDTVDNSVDFGPPMTSGETPERESARVIARGSIPAPQAFRFDNPFSSVSFGEGSLWATELLPVENFECNDTGIRRFGSVDGVPVESVACAAPRREISRRLDPETLEVGPRVLPEDVYGRAAFGAGSVWIPRFGGESGEDAVLRLDPDTSEITREFPVESPLSVAFGQGTVWVAGDYGTVYRIGPETNAAVGETRVSDGYIRDLAVGAGAVWVASENPGPGEKTNSSGNELVRLDRETGEVTARTPVGNVGELGGASGVAAGEGAVWVTNTDDEVLRVDPETGAVAARLDLEGCSDIATSPGAVWAACTTSEGSLDTTRLVRIKPETNEVTGSVEVEGYSPYGLEVGGGAVWFTASGPEDSGGVLIRVPL